MKKLFLLIFVGTILFNVIDGVAQRQPSNRQESENAFWERRNTFIKAEIGLTAEEANKFIPLENEFKQKMLEVGRECRSLTRESQNSQKLTDAERLKLIDCYLDSRIKEAQLEKEYYEQFKKVISPEKLYKYHDADTKFARELINMQRTASPFRNNSVFPLNRNNPNGPGNRNNPNGQVNRDNTNQPRNRR